MKTFALIAITVLFCSGSLHAQGESALPFLTISPSAVSNGMGEASVALYRDDPLAVSSNPAHLGMFSRSNYFNAGYDFTDWLPQFRQSDLTFRSYGFAAGVNLQKQFGIDPEVSVGLAYTHNRLNLGEFNETSPDGPEVISTFEAFETAANYSVGAGFHYWVSLSAGYTIKQVHSNLAPFNVQGQARTGSASVSAYDFGFLLALPVMDVAGKLRGSPLTILPGFSPLLNFTVGIAKNNMGDKMVVYVDPSQPDPLPRTARAGVGIELGFMYTGGEMDWQPVRFGWTRESNDLLVRRFPAPVDSFGVVIGDPPPPEYRSGLGDIRFVDDLILGKSNPEAITKTGWQLDLGEIIAIRGGRFLEAPDRGNRRFCTSGYTIRFGGVIRGLRLLKLPVGPDNLLGAIINHLDIRYTHSELDADSRSSPLDDTEFNSWTLVLSSW